MGCRIRIGDKIILYTSSGVIETLYHEFLEEIQQQKIPMNKDLENFVDKLQVSAITLGGEWFDVEKEVSSSKNLGIILDILENVIDKIKLEVADFALKDLWNFYAELCIYKEQLEQKGH